MRKVLVVEDEASFRALLERVLRRAGMEPTCAADGEEAVALLQRESFDLVISDWNMPRMDGCQLVRWLRKTPATRGVPVLMLTVRRLPEEEVEGFECGADDYLSKPYSPKELMARVVRLVGANGTGAQALQ